MTTTQTISDKERAILDCAITLLRDGGDANMTMRKIAECADMRLSNVQYYFKTRDDVLKAMVGTYFEDCMAELQRLAEEIVDDDTRTRTKRLVAICLHHGVEVSDMCRIFRELWAISSRNEDINTNLMRYYERFSALLVVIILGDNGGEATNKRLRSLLLPFFEGYSITAPSLPLGIDEVTEMVTDIVMAEIERG